MQIHITIDTEEDAGRGGQLTAIAKILGSSVTAAPPVKLAPSKITAEPEPPSKATKPAAMKAKKAEPVEAVPGRAQLQAKATEAVKAGKREEYREVLARFNAARFAEVDEESYPAFDKALDELLAGLTMQDKRFKAIACAVNGGFTEEAAGA